MPVLRFFFLSTCCLLLLQPAFAATPAKVEKILFYHKSDAETRYIAKRAAWQSENRGAIALEDAEPLALEAYEEASLEKPLELWRRHGGAHPQVITAKAYLQNPTDKALLDLKLQVTVRAKRGELRVDPQLLLTDYDHLNRTGTWEQILQYTQTIPVLAPGEEILAPILQFQLLRYLRFHPNQWPESLQVEVVLLNTKPSQKKLATLRLIPDHFVLPTELQQ